MKRTIPMTLLCLLMLVLAYGDSRAQGKECYDCKGPGYEPGAGGCNTCLRHSGGDYVSCIPYCNGTCSVGPGEGCGDVTYRNLRLSPDGSPREPSTLTTPAAVLVSGSAQPQRNCLGFVVRRTVLSLTSDLNGTEVSFSL